MSFMDTYQTWLHSTALSSEEKAELEQIAHDPKEIESRFSTSSPSAQPDCEAPWVPGSIR